VSGGMLSFAILVAAAAAQAAPSAIPTSGSVLLRSLEAGDGAAVRAMLAPDATVAKDREGEVSVDTVIAHLRGCTRGELFWDYDEEDRSRATVTAVYACPARIELHAWTSRAGIAWIQIFTASPASAGDSVR